MRDEIVQMFAQRMSEQDREKKAAKLYAFIVSDHFKNIFKTLEGNDDKMLKLEE